MGPLGCERGGRNLRRALGPVKHGRDAARIALRSLLVQGSWNYRDLLGSGSLWVILPLIRQASQDGSTLPEELVGTFNGHPAVLPAGLGAQVTLVREGALLDRILPLRSALSGPLGSLGDGFFWGALRPLILVGIILAGTLGVPPLVALLVGGIAYNWVHLRTRYRCAAVGLERGIHVGGGLRDLALAQRAEELGRLGVVVIGALLEVGVAALIRTPEGSSIAFPVLAGLGVTLVLSFRRGTHPSWLPGLLLGTLVLGALGLGALVAGP